MSIKAIAWAWEQELKASTKLVLMALADCHSSATGETYPSVAYLVRKTGLSRACVFEQLGKLTSGGFICIHQCFNDEGRQINNRYTLNMHIVQKLDGEGPAGVLPRVQEADGGRVQEVDTEPRVEEPEVVTKDISIKSLETDFALFWRNYPRHVGRSCAEACFLKAVKKGHDPGMIVRKVAEFAAHCKRNGRAIQFIPHPSTWLNQERWNDELVDDQPEVNNGRPNAKEELLKWAFGEDEQVAVCPPGDLTVLPGGDSWDTEGQGSSIFDVPKRIRGPCG